MEVLKDFMNKVGISGESIKDFMNRVGMSGESIRTSQADLFPLCISREQTNMAVP